MQGEFLDGKKHGQGVFVVGNGDVYDGGFRKDMYHGQGVLKYVNGDRYTGSWKNGLFHGQGKLRKANGDLYDVRSAMVSMVLTRSRFDLATTCAG